MSRKVSDNDRELFRHSVGKVSALKSNDKMPPATKKPSTRVRHTPIDDIEHAKTLVHPPAEVSMEDGLFFARMGVQPKQLKQLRQGKLACEAECDLHGLTTRQAEAELDEFIYQCLASDLRVIRIVHGKGHRSTVQKPVLKNLINHNLREYDNVLAFCSAIPKDGGLGAVYILLKNQRRS